MTQRVALVGLVLLVAGCPGSGPPSAEAVAEAQGIWKERCSRCHGDAGMGDGPGAAILPVKPRALADSAWQSSVTDEHIASVIVDGGKPHGLDAQMAANPDLKAKPEVLRALVQFVRGL